MKNISWLLLLVFSISCAGKGKDSTVAPPPVNADTTFSNPLLDGGADPWVYKNGNAYYFLCTNGGNISIRKTAAMSALREATPKVVWTPPATGANSRNIWAPELHRINGKWYLYYTAGASGDLSTQRLFVLENEAAEPLDGVWKDKGKIYDPPADWFAIDGTVLTYKNKNYFIWSGQISNKDITQRIYIAEMENPWTLKTARVQISMPDYAWEKNGIPVNEGPEILQGPNGQVMLVYSASSCGTDDYALGMLRLKEDGDPLNPADWTKSDKPVFTKSVANSVYGPGHNGFFKSKDGKEDWIIYHANPHAGQGCGGARSPRMQRFTWNADGSPDFGEPLNPYYKLRKPSGE